MKINQTEEQTITELELQQLFLSYYNAPDMKTKQQIRNYIFDCNIRLVYYVINRHVYHQPEKKDVLNDAFFGLITAIETFDLSRGVKFSTYAYKCIENAIYDANKRYQQHDYISLDAPVSEGLYLYELIPSDENTLENVEQEDNTRKQLMEIMRIIQTLDHRDQEIFTKYFGINQNRRYSVAELQLEYQIGSSQGIYHIINKIRKIIIAITTKKALAISENSIIDRIQLFDQKYQEMYKMYCGIGYNHKYSITEIATFFKTTGYYVSTILKKIKEEIFYQIENDIKTNINNEITEVLNLISLFPPKEQNIYIMYYGLNYSSCYSISEIVAECQVNSTIVRQTISKIDKYLLSQNYHQQMHAIKVRRNVR